MLACAALLPDLVTAVVSLAGLAPFDAFPASKPGWFDDYGHGSLAENRVPEVHAWLSEHR